MPTASPARLRADGAGSDEHDELLRWVSELYYLREQGQAEIASLIGVSVSKVSRLLAEARQRGIVNIQVAASVAGESDLERSLAARFGLTAAFIAPARVTDAAAASRVAALGAARVLPRLLPRRGLVGFSGGYTVAQLATQLQPLPAADLTIVPLQGNWTEGGRHLHNDQVCRDAAMRLGAEALTLPAPMVVEHAATRDALLDDRSIRSVTKRWSELDCAIVGVGAAPGVQTTGYTSVVGLLPPGVRDDLRRSDVVGDVCAHMFDVQGRFVDHEVSRRTLTIPVADLRRVPTVVAVAGGVSKTPSLLGALRTGVVHVLITDQLTAERILADVDSR